MRFEPLTTPNEAPPINPSCETFPPPLPLTIADCQSAAQQIANLRYSYSPTERRTLNQSRMRDGRLNQQPPRRPRLNQRSASTSAASQPATRLNVPLAAHPTARIQHPMA